MIALFFCLYRVTEVIGIHNKLPKLDKETLPKFIRSNEGKSVIIFSDFPEYCHFVKFSIARLNDEYKLYLKDSKQTDETGSNYEKIIKFAFAPESEGKAFNCSAFPCPVPFDNGRQVSELQPAPIQASIFYSWIKKFLNPRYTEIPNSERLRNIFNQLGGFYVIGVDTPDIPSDLPESMNYYSASLELFENLNMTNISKGVYVYRAADRTLNEVINGNYEELSETNLVSFNDVDFSKKKFVAGFWFNETDPKTCEYEIKIMSELSKDFGNDFYFAPLGNEVIYSNKLHFQPTPLFMVLSKNDQSEIDPQTGLLKKLDHWTLGGEESHNKDKLSEFLSKIKSGELPYKPLSNRNETDPRSLSFNDFNDAVQQDMDVIVIVARDFKRFVDIVSTVDVVVDHLNASDQITYYHINFTMNDVPDSLNPSPDATFYIFPKGNKEKPVPYYLTRLMFFDVLNFVTRNAGNKYDVPRFYLKEKDDLIKLVKNRLLPPDFDNSTSITNTTQGN